MKYFFYGISLILIAGTAWAQPGRSSAEQACSRLTPEATREACYKLIPDSKFDPVAVAVCDRMPDSEDTFECMRTVQDGTYYNHNAIAACEKAQSPSWISNCLDEVADEGFQDDAVNVCRHSDPSLIPQCMEAIASRVFTQSELTQCRAKGNSEETIKCLRSSGEDDADEKKFREDQKKWQDSLKAKAQPQASSASHPQLFKNALKAMQSDPHYFDKCVPIKQDSNDELEEQIKKLNIVIYKCG
jgi:hypothetical protein